MAFREIYRRQAALLVRILPFIAEEDSLALKGGTAINLFLRDMPRLSVDIDLTYVPIEPFPGSLASIELALLRIAKRIRVWGHQFDNTAYPKAAQTSRRHRKATPSPG